MKEGIEKRIYTEGIFDVFNDTDHINDWYEKGFPELMWGLGFDMDCYNSYMTKYPNTNIEGKTLKEEQDEILSNLNNSDEVMVGNYIFSRFRELTHWSDYGYDDLQCGYFFPKAFRILENKLRIRK